MAVSYVTTVVSQDTSLLIVGLDLQSWLYLKNHSFKMVTAEEILVITTQPSGKYGMVSNPVSPITQERALP